ncbi:putative protein S-acyltransferase [Helianthus annuus]|nr:putative protein S-acyltransferase [Helianthus annuus]
MEPNSSFKVQFYQPPLPKITVHFSYRNHTSNTMVLQTQKTKSKIRELTLREISDIKLTIEVPATYNNQDANAARVGSKQSVKNVKNLDSRTDDNVSETVKSTAKPCWFVALVPCAWMCGCSSSNDESTELQTSEDGMFYYSFCEVEVFKYNKHCRL